MKPLSRQWLRKTDRDHSISWIEYHKYRCRYDVEYREEFERACTALEMQLGVRLGVNTDISVGKVS